MKTLKVICTALVLALVFSVPAYAGDISTPGVKSSSPITTSAAGETESHFQPICIRQTFSSFF